MESGLTASACVTDTVLPPGVLQPASGMAPHSASTRCARRLRAVGWIRLGTELPPSWWVATRSRCTIDMAPSCMRRMHEAGRGDRGCNREVYSSRMLLATAAISAIQHFEDIQRRPLGERVVDVLRLPAG